MTDNLQRFGNPAVFEIAARWSVDPQPRERLPLLEGWSTGELRLTVCGQVLTAHWLHGAMQDSLSWYLSPVVDWLLRHWTYLLHEESYAWADKYGQSAALATFTALDKAMLAAADGEDGLAQYTRIHAWHTRHALRAADASGLYPDVYLRRLGDAVEVSWLARQPDFAPDSFALMLAPGSVLLPVQAVAQPLWQFLQWATSTAPAQNAADAQVISDLQQRFTALAATPLTTLEQTYVGERVHALLAQARCAASDDAASMDASTLVGEGVPAVASFAAPVLMFGGLNVTLSEADIQFLLGFLTEQAGGNDCPLLANLIDSPAPANLTPPYEEGYELAHDCRAALHIAPDAIRVDMDAVLAQLKIKVSSHTLQTSTIRGVAVAGEGFSPAVLLNKHSVFNNTEAGRRFTLAHELCHILHDRTRARKLSHISGPWASAHVEKRANAFAAMFLAPPSAIQQRLGAITHDAVRQLARDVGMGMSALIEHLFNTDLINEDQREFLRQI